MGLLRRSKNLSKCRELREGLEWDEGGAMGALVPSSPVDGNRDARLLPYGRERGEEVAVEEACTKVVEKSSERSLFARTFWATESPE